MNILAIMSRSRSSVEAQHFSDWMWQPDDPELAVYKAIANKACDLLRSTGAPELNSVTLNVSHKNGLSILHFDGGGLWLDEDEQLDVSDMVNALHEGPTLKQIRTGGLRLVPPPDTAMVIQYSDCNLPNAVRRTSSVQDLVRRAISLLRDSNVVKSLTT